jgi:tetratricopeptide (TPR) repeat protein
MLCENRLWKLPFMLVMMATLGVGRAALSQAPAAEEPDVDEAAVIPSYPFDYDWQPPYTWYERRWNERFPAPYRKPFRSEYYPYGRPYPANLHYGYPYHSRYPYGDSRYYDYPFDSGYQSGFYDGRRYQKWAARAERSAQSYLLAMQNGGEFFRNGDYSSAARQFTLACELNQGDAASRLRLVMALVALGEYEAAAPALRRAIQLQAKVVHLPLNVEQDYGAISDFDAHLKKLESAAQAQANNESLWLLLGYCQLFSSRASKAADTLSTAINLAPADNAALRLHEAARLYKQASPRPTFQPPAPDRPQRSEST